MKPPLSWLLRLYPKAWRDRYGDEFEALVDDKGTAWYHLSDIFIEALKMRIASMNWKLITSFGLAGLIVAAVVSWQMPNRYVSRAVLEVIAPPGTSPDAAIERIMQLQSRTLSRTSLSNVIQSPALNLYKDQRASKPLEDVIEDMKDHDLRIELDSKLHSSGRPFVITFAANDRVLAQATVRQLMTRLMDENIKVAASQIPMKLDVLDPANLPTTPVSPNRLVIILAGLLFGLVAGGAIAWWRGDRRPPRGKGPLAQHPGSAFLLSVLMIVAGADLAVGIAPWPYFSRATLEFKSQESRSQAIADKLKLTNGLLESVYGDGSWFAVKITPTSGSRASVTVRYSNRFKAQMMLHNLISRIPEATLIDPPSLASDAPTGIYGPALLLAGILLAVMTTAALLRRRRQKLSTLQTA